MALETTLPARELRTQLHPPVGRHQPQDPLSPLLCMPGSLLWPLKEPHPPGGRHQTQENHSPIVCIRSLPTSRPDPALGPAGLWPCPLAGQHKLWNTLDPIPNCIRNWPPATSDPSPALGPLDPTTRLQVLALPTSRPAFNPRTWVHPPVSR